MLRLLLATCVIALVATACSFWSGERENPATKAPDATASCPVTLPNGNAPPTESDCPLCYGNGELWVGLWPEGTVIFEPNGPGQVTDNSLSMKFWMWRKGSGDLTIEGHRLDAEAPPLAASIPDGYPSGFQATSLIFSSPGCWEVIAKVDNASLTFVTLVEDKTQT